MQSDLNTEISVDYYYENNSKLDEVYLSSNLYLPLDLPIEEVTVDDIVYSVTPENYIHGLPKKRIKKGDVCLIPIKFTISDFIQEYPPSYIVSHNLKFVGDKPKNITLMYFLPDMGNHKKIKYNFMPNAKSKKFLNYNKKTKIIMSNEIHTPLFVNVGFKYQKSSYKLLFIIILTMIIASVVGAYCLIKDGSSPYYVIGSFLLAFALFIPSLFSFQSLKEKMECLL